MIIMIDPNLYTISIRKENTEDGECFVSRIAELPDALDYADTYDEVLSLARETITFTYEAFQKRGMDFPTPQEIKEYDVSGRVTLRMPKHLHRGLAKQSEEEGVSLNALIVANLSERYGADQIINVVETYTRLAVQKERSDLQQRRDTTHHAKTTIAFSPEDYPPMNIQRHPPCLN